MLAAFPKYSAGSIIPHTNGFAQNFCVIHFAYDSAKELETIIEFIQNTVKVYDINGNDMIIHKSKEFVNGLLRDFQ